MALIDGEGTIVESNVAFAALIGTDARKLKDRAVYDFLRDQTVQEARARLTSLAGLHVERLGAYAESEPG